MKDAQSLDKIASDDDLFAKKVKAKEIFGSNLSLGEKQVRASAPNLDSFLTDSLADSGRNSGETQWACLRHAHALARSEPLSSILVGQVGIEPTRPCGQEILSLSRLPITPLAHDYLCFYPYVLFAGYDNLDTVSSNCSIYCRVCSH